MTSIAQMLSSLPLLSEAASAAVEGVESAAHGAAGHAEHAHEVSAKAQQFFPDQPLLAVVTNSLFVAVIVTVGILWFVRSGMKKRAMVPGKKQNFVELIVEFLYNQVENIVGPKVAPHAFPLLATIFIFVTAANWFGLLPGVGTVGLAHDIGAYRSSDNIEVPLLRPATADMNMTIGIALFAMVIWFILTIKELGFLGFLHHTFGPKGGLQGGLKYGLMPIFFIVGVIEVISILFRPMTLSLRLYGNIFAGENLLHTMSSLVKGHPILEFLGSVAVPLPFYFLEILVGVLQGMVFALLCAVFIKLSTTHEEGHGDEEHGHAH